MAESIRRLLVDDQKLMREGLRVLPKMEPDLRVVAEAASGHDALDAYEAHPSDVILMDVRMPNTDSREATWRLRATMLTTFDKDECVFEGLRAGALGYVLKDVSGVK